MVRLNRLALGGALAALGSGGAAAGLRAEFQGIGFVPDAFSPFSAAYGVSADGRVVVGQARTPVGYEAFRWTLEDGLEPIGDLPGGDVNSYAYATSADGSVIVGRGRGPAGQPEFEAFRWTEHGGFLPLGVLNPDSVATHSAAHAVSADGSVIVGYSSWVREGGSTFDTQAFRWTARTGMVGLGDLEGGEFDSRALGVSADGKVVVGTGTTFGGSFGYFQGFWWTSGIGLTALGPMPPTPNDMSWMNAISADGATVVGRKFDQGRPVRWTVTEGFEYLSDPNATRGDSYGVSADGSVIVGYQQIFIVGQGYKDRAFLWTEDGGYRLLHAALQNEFGLNLGGWTLSRAYGVSGDGRVIVGVGLNPQGQTEGWVVRITGVTGCAPDLDGDGAVTDIDLGILLAGFGQSALGDVDGDGDTDDSDLGLLLDAFGNVCA